MPIEIDAFLSAHQFICIPCLAAMTGRDAHDVRNAVMMLLTERRAESEDGECVNCNERAFVVRRR